MNFKQFIEAVKVRLSGLVGPDSEVLIRENIKVNDTKKIGVIIKHKDSKVMPTVYLEEYFDRYKEGSDIESITDEIMLIFSTAVLPDITMLDDLSKVENIKDKIMYRIINKSKNSELLSDLPYRDYLDFAITYYLLMGKELGACMTVKIETCHMENWGLSEHDLYQIAKENTCRDMLVNVSTISHVIIRGAPMGESGITDDEDSMYSLSNNYIHYGAATILYDGVLDEIYNKLGEEFFIFPSSVHDLTICPKSTVDDKQQLYDMVRGGNTVACSEDEFLSENVYHYRKGEGLIILQ